MMAFRKNKRASQGAAAQTSAVATTPEAQFGLAGDHSSSFGATLFTCALFVVVLALVLGVGGLVAGAITLPLIIVAVLAATLLAMTVHVAQEWERVVVLRLGTLNRISGPGLFWTIPVIESNAARIDMRMRVTTFSATETLTSDLVPLNVDAVLFWMVHDPKAACLDVEDFPRSVQLAAQSTLRSAIGRASAAEVAIKRSQLDKELKEKLASQVEPWGISIVDVEVRDILLPKELQKPMAVEALAEQLRKARLALADAESDIGAMLAAAAEENYTGPEDALRLRNMQALTESVRETGGTVVLPSSFADGLGDVLPKG